MTHPFADCCPKCLTVDSEPVTPHKVEDLDGSHVRARYRCLSPSCGHSWFTGWDAAYVLERNGPFGGAA